MTTNSSPKLVNGLLKGLVHEGVDVLFWVCVEPRKSIGPLVNSKPVVEYK